MVLSFLALCALFESAASAGPTAALLGGLSIPVQPRSASSTGIVGGAILGYRVEVGPARVTPELFARLNTGAPFAAVSAGASASFGGPVALGPYAHIGVGVLGYPLPSLDAGLLAEVSPLPHLDVGLRTGFTLDHPARYKCGDCPQPAMDWWIVGATAGVSL